MRDKIRIYCLNIRVNGSRQPCHPRAFGYWKRIFPKCDALRPELSWIYYRLLIGVLLKVHNHITQGYNSYQLSLPPEYMNLISEVSVTADCVRLSPGCQNTIKKIRKSYSNGWFSTSSYTTTMITTETMAFFTLENRNGNSRLCMMSYPHLW